MDAEVAGIRFLPNEPISGPQGGRSYPVSLVACSVRGSECPRPGRTAACSKSSPIKVNQGKSRWIKVNQTIMNPIPCANIRCGDIVN